MSCYYDTVKLSCAKSQFFFNFNINLENKMNFESI